MKVLSIIAATAALFATLQVFASEDNKELGAYLGAKDVDHPAWFKESFLDLEEDIADAAAEGKRLALYFYQPGCPYCAELIQNNFTNPDIAQTMQSDFDLVAINMWGDREVIQVGGHSFSEKTLAEALRVNYTPTLMFFTEKQDIALRIDGYLPPERFKLALSYVSGGHEKSETFNDYLAARIDTGTPGTLKTEPFFKGTSDLTTLIDDDKYIAVYFEQTECEACDALHEKVLKDPATRELAMQFGSVQFDMWGDTAVTTPQGESTSAREWARSLELDYAPSIIFFDSSGREVMRIDAQLHTFHVQSVFEYVLTKSYDSEPNFQRYISARAEHLREQGIDVDIWSY